MGLKLMTDLPIMSQTQYQMHHATIKKTPDKSLTNTIPAPYTHFQSSDGITTLTIITWNKKTRDYYSSAIKHDKKLQ